MEQSFQGFQMVVESLAAHNGCCVGSLRFAAHELLPQFHITFRFQYFHVAGQVAVRQAEHLLEGAKLHPIVHHQDGHNAQPDPVVEFGVVEFVEEMFHLY